MAYNDKIIIQQKSVSADTYGERDATWTTYKTVWAERQDQNGYKSDQTDMPVFTDGISFKIHAHDAPDVTTKMRVSYDSLYWDIIRMERSGRLHYILYVESYDDE